MNSMCTSSELPTLQPQQPLCRYYDRSLQEVVISLCDFLTAANMMICALTSA